MPGELKGDTPGQQPEEVSIKTEQLPASTEPMLGQEPTVPIDQTDVIKKEDGPDSLPEVLPSVVVDLLVPMSLTQTPMSKHGYEYLEALDDPKIPDHRSVHMLIQLQGLWYGARTNLAVELGLIDQELCNAMRDLIARFDTLSPDEQDYQVKNIFRSSLTAYSIMAESNLFAAGLLESEAPAELIHRFVTVRAQGKIADLSAKESESIRTTPGKKYTKEYELSRELKDTAAQCNLLIREAQRRQADVLQGIEAENQERKTKIFQEFDEILVALE